MAVEGLEAGSAVAVAVEAGTLVVEEVVIVVEEEATVSCQIIPNRFNLTASGGGSGYDRGGRGGRSKTVIPSFDTMD